MSQITHRARKDAIELFVEPLRGAINKFVHGRLIYELPEIGSDASIILNGIEQPTEIPTRTGFKAPLGVMVQLYVRMSDQAGQPLVTTVGYSHSLWVANVETVAYHWHPISTPFVAFPHMHYEGGHQHIPTGRILVEDLFVAALEYGAKPRPGWKKSFSDSYAAFESDATWGQAASNRSDWLNRWTDLGEPIGGSL